MIATYPAVGHSCKDARTILVSQSVGRKKDKRIANRRHRRYLNAATRSFVRDPGRFDCEGFDAPTLTSWELC